MAINDGGAEPRPRRLPQFIQENIELIVAEWEISARTLMPASSGMTPHALRDHIHQILAFIVPDMKVFQSSEQKSAKSH